MRLIDRCKIIHKNNQTKIFICFLFLILFSFLFNNNSVSATTGTLTMSIPDGISLNILPSASGTFASTSGTISVSTTYASGYTLGIKATSNNNNALINTNDSNKTIPSITSSISESTFSTNSTYNDKWGYKPSKLNSSANSNYLEAPTSTTTTTLDQTSSSNSTANTYTIAIGTRLSNATAPGTYENTFVFTVLANPTPYTITYNANDGASGADTTNMPTPNPNSSSTYADTVTLSNTVPVRNGYNFKGWCTVQVADGAACSGTTYNPDGGGTNLTWTIDQTQSSNTITLYARWELAAVSMQQMSESDCVSSGPTTVKDARDGTTYLVQRLADGNCWMLDNLALDPTAVSEATLKGNTNASDATIGYLKNGGGLGRYTGTAVSSTWSDSYNTPRINAASKDTTVTSYGAGSGKVGVYYNFCAASAGSYCFASGSGTGNATEDLCPAGWRMPTGGDSSGEYKALYTAYSSNDTNFRNALSTPLSGLFFSGSADYQGDSGFWWSSTISDSYGLYFLLVDADGTNLAGGGVRDSGFSMRCIKKTPYMQDVTNSDLDDMIPNAGDTVTLADKRDDTKYLVGRLSDGNVWMLDNLALDPTQFTQAQLYGTGADAGKMTNASNTTLGYLKNGGGSGQYPASGVSNAWTSGSQDSYNLPYINAASKDTTVTSYGAGSGKVGVYYNYCAASAGSYCYASGSGTGNATEDLCPAGWRMPTGDSSGEYKALYTAYSSNATNFINALSTPLSGWFYSGSTYSQGDRGFWWSSTISDDDDLVYSLGVGGADYAYPTDEIDRNMGYSMRCIKQPPTIDDVEYLQDIDSDIAETMVQGTTYTKKDKRDETSYHIAKLADDNVWMLDNLALDPTAVPLATLQGNTNASNTTLGYLKNGGGSGQYPASGVSNAWTSSSQDSYNLPYINAASKDTTVTSYGAGSGKVGVYYNYCAASAGSYCYARGSGTGNATEDLCPAGWRMPTGKMNGEYGGFCIAYDSDCESNEYSEISASNTSSLQYNLSTPLSGYFYSGSAVDQGDGGYWWSSTIDDGINMFYLGVFADYADPTYYGYGRSYGRSMRCLLDY